MIHDVSDPVYSNLRNKSKSAKKQKCGKTIATHLPKFNIDGSNKSTYIDARISATIITVPFHTLSANFY